MQSRYRKLPEHHKIRVGSCLLTDAILANRSANVVQLWTFRSNKSGLAISSLTVATARLSA